jgi:precorrin-6B methylase 2
MKEPKTLLTSVTPSSQEFSALLENATSGFKKYQLIMAALETGLFEHTTTPKTSQAIAQELGNYHEAMLQMFCDALVELGLLTKQQNTYINSPLTSTYLCQNSPHYMEYTLKNRKTNISHWMQLNTVLKSGPLKRNRTDFFNEGWLTSIAEGAAAGSVADVLSIITAHLDPKNWKRLLDLGGGHGLYAIAFTALNPMLEAYVFDLPNVVPITSKYVAEYHAERVHILPGDFYKDDFGKDYDVIFSSFNQSCFDPTFIGKLVQAVVPGGYLILRRFKDSSREGAIQTLDWNLIGFEGRKIGSKAHSSDSVVDQKTYLAQLEKAGLTVVGTFSVDEISEVTFARKPLSNGSDN